MEERKSVTAGAVVYLLLLAACIALVRPFVNTGVSDDFSFIKSAKDFADTGRMVYNGWSSPILGWMLPLGALFIKLFGFSFGVVRCASVLIAAVNGLLLQWILLRLGCTRVMALFGATAVLLSPLSLPEAMVFFTDQPGLLGVLVTIALCIRIVRAETPRTTQYWIAVAFAASFVLGTARQSSWICTLVIVPSAVWLVRRQKGVLPWGVACFVVSAGGIFAMMQWWNRQPYGLKDPLIVHYPLSAWARYVILPGMELIVELAPVLSLFLVRRVPRNVYAASVALLVLVPLIISRNPYDLLHLVGRDLLGGMPPWFVLVVLAYSFALLPITFRTAYEALAVGRTSVGHGELDLRQLSIVLAPFSLALFVLVSTRGALFPRYLLPVMVVVAIWLVKLWSDQPGERRSCGVVGPALVAIFCAITVMQMHDLFRETEAVLSLTQWYTAQGLPRDQLEAGHAFDGTYQIQRTGYINDPRIKVPAGAYVNHDLTADIAPCHNFFLPYTPSIRPIYGISETVAPCFEEPVLYTVQYTAWMAPHQHEIFIARFASKYALPMR